VRISNVPELNSAPNAAANSFLLFAFKVISFF
jgi:hypothetical protein